MTDATEPLDRMPSTAGTGSGTSDMRDATGRLTPGLYFTLAFVTYLLTSPKWTIALASWLAPLFVLLALRHTKAWSGFLWTYMVLVASSLIGGYGVVPLPFVALVIATLIGCLFSCIPFLLHRLFAQGQRGLWRTLIFPTSVVILDYLLAFGPQGVWSSPANTQYAFLPLIQLVSVTGLWGITFLMAWFAATASLIVDSWRDERSTATRSALAFGSVFALVLGFGVLRLLMASPPASNVMVAGISTENISAMTTAYEADTGESMSLPSRTSQSDPRLVKVMGSVQRFIEDPRAERFAPVHDEMQVIEDRLFESSRRAVAQGSKIIVWSEGVVTRVKTDEESLIERAQAFSREHQVYFFLSFAAVRPGKITPGRKYLENKVLCIWPDGQIVYTFFKNVPVFGVEPCVPGDGVIPALETEFGKVSPSICYDADFPRHMRQLGQQATDVLLLPSGDWDAIAPYHSYMAMMRAIENGCALVRVTGRGTSLATDAYGRTLATHDFFEDPDGILLARVPVQSVATAYTQLGDIFAGLCGVTLLGLLALHGVIRKRSGARTRGQCL